MKIGVHLGIDTSNYTTSAAVVTTAGEVFCAKRPLPVPDGDRGLRQSDALFCHTKALSQVILECMAPLRERYGAWEILSVGVSDRPRRVPGSYMPCFLAGVSVARSVAAMASVPFFAFSHQEGHIEAARRGAASQGRALTAERFFAFHLSGGTTELLAVTEDQGRYRAELKAEALDLTLGQLVDRAGMALGLSFPAGSSLETLALSSEFRKEKVRIPKKETGINLSGFENRFLQRMTKGEDRVALAQSIFSVCVEAVSALMEIAEVGKAPVLFSGGVASSSILKRVFSEDRFYFAPPSYSADNAIGIAYLAEKGAANGFQASLDRHGS